MFLMRSFERRFKRVANCATQSSMSTFVTIHEPVDTSDSSSEPPPLKTVATATSVVYTSYDPGAPPPKPADSDTRHWIRFVCISDTHNRTFPVPDGDVLLHGGDLTSTGREQEMMITCDWIASMTHHVKIVIAGNHDLTLDEKWYPTNFRRFHRGPSEDMKAVRRKLTGQKAKGAGIVYLEDEKYEFCLRKGGRNFTVFGSPWSPEFYNWAFNYDRIIQGDRIIQAIPQVDILLTHGPPANHLDRTMHGDIAGCQALEHRLKNPNLAPLIHVCGHIHEARGVEILRRSQAGVMEVTHRLGAEDEDIAPVIPDSTPGDGSDLEPPKQTVLVNAANWPAGNRVGRGSWLKGFGAYPFQPVIIDLLEEA